ncbi:MAG: amidohydrolase family protein [Dehalococcoidia bacterium]
MIIDGHSHILSLSDDPEFTYQYGREGSLCIFRSRGQLPSHRLPTDAEWEASGVTRSGFLLIGPRDSIRDHPGFDKILILAISPQMLEGRLIGTVDTEGVTAVPGPPSPQKCNDYIAAIVRRQPRTFIGFGSVNPMHQGVQAAVEELERCALELGLHGIKLYPMYQHWSPDDPKISFPIFQRAAELDLPVMVHQAGSTRIDAKMAYARPALLDDIGREFRDLRVIIAHVGLPWLDETLLLLTKHPNFYTELSYMIATHTRADLFRFLQRCEPYFVPLEKLFFGSDYPGFTYDPVALRDKLLTVNDEADHLHAKPIPQGKLDGIMGDNLARVLRLADAPADSVNGPA